MRNLRIGIIIFICGLTGIVSTAISEEAEKSPCQPNYTASKAEGTETLNALEELRGQCIGLMEEGKGYKEVYENRVSDLSAQMKEGESASQSMDATVQIKGTKPYFQKQCKQAKDAAKKDIGGLMKENRSKVNNRLRELKSAKDKNIKNYEFVIGHSKDQQIINSSKQVIQDLNSCYAATEGQCNGAFEGMDYTVGLINDQGKQCGTLASAEEAIKDRSKSSGSSSNMNDALAIMTMGNMGTGMAGNLAALANKNGQGGQGSNLSDNLNKLFDPSSDEPSIVSPSEMCAAFGNGFQFNASTGRCGSSQVSSSNCSQGGAGYMYQNGTCVSLLTPEQICLQKSSQGFSWDGKQCVQKGNPSCGTGQKLDSTGKCVAIAPPDKADEKQDELGDLVGDKKEDHSLQVEKVEEKKGSKLGGSLGEPFTPQTQANSSSLGSSLSERFGKKKDPDSKETKGPEKTGENLAMSGNGDFGGSQESYGSESHSREEAAKKEGAGAATEEERIPSSLGGEDEFVFSSVSRIYDGLLSTGTEHDPFGIVYQSLQETKL